MVYLAVGANCSPQAKIAGWAPVRGSVFLLRLRNTPATANVRADFFQRKEKIEEFLGGMREFSSSSGHSSVEPLFQFSCGMKKNSTRVYSAGGLRIQRTRRCRPRCVFCGRRWPLFTGAGRLKATETWMGHCARSHLTA